MTTLSINGRDHSVDVPSDTPLLWVIREHLQMTGTKFGCGAGFRRARTLAADHGGSRQGGDEDLSGRVTTILKTRERHPIGAALRVSRNGRDRTSTACRTD